MEEKRYCKLKNQTSIYEVVRIDEKDNVILKDKNKLIHTNIQNISFVSKPKEKTKCETYSIQIEKENVTNEIMLRHLTREEALVELDRFIDKAVANRLPQVKIIHGRHGKILRDAVRDYLDKCPFVISYDYADYSQGSIGVTVATLGKKKA